ncbi:formate/nitrite transporter family protein [Geodermatophilus sp. SYSU D00758]
MSVAPDPSDIYRRAQEEGRRRLGLSFLEQVATGFIAGFTIVFGIVALGVVTAELEATVPFETAELGGALAFALGLVFLIVGRTELFSENFFDPVAAAISERGRRVWLRLLRLWVLILALNLMGGAVLVALMTVQGALPGASDEVLVRIAENIAAKGWAATLVRAVFAGALLSLLSYMLHATDTVVARILLAFLVGFLLALGTFDHVVVSVLHILFGIWLGGAVGYGDLLLNLGLATVGNLVGGVLLMTLTHTAQEKG